MKEQQQQKRLFINYEYGGYHSLETGVSQLGGHQGIDLTEPTYQ
jgi:hypothetical protein